MYIKNWNLKKAVGITIKSKQTNNQLKPVTRNTYAPSCIGYRYNSEPNGCVHIRGETIQINAILRIAFECIVIYCHIAIFDRI